MNEGSLSVSLIPTSSILHCTYKGVRADLLDGFGDHLGVGQDTGRGVDYGRSMKAVSNASEAKGTTPLTMRESEDLVLVLLESLGDLLLARRRVYTSTICGEYGTEE